jgi:cytidylate kinase
MSKSRLRQELVIAIDGPSGVGKSTIARRLASRLDFRYIDSGAMYRAVALMARERGVSLEDPKGLADLGREMEIEYEGGRHGMRILLSGEDVTDRLRLPGVSEEASCLSQFPEVRNALVEKQRELGQQGNVVMEGRDIGTVVFPGAALKIFLDADMEERARRRHLQWKEKGVEVSRETLAEEIHARDQRDRTRSVAPLMAASDATRVDTTELEPDQVLEQILCLLSEGNLLGDEEERPKTEP